MLSDDQRFHWAEGMKHASEGIRSFFYLNGAASIAALTFIGHTGTVTPNLIWAMVLFASGALAASFSHAFACLTQLQYGNEAIEESGWTDEERLAGTPQEVRTGGVRVFASVSFSGERSDIAVALVIDDTADPARRVACTVGMPFGFRLGV